MSSAPAFVCTSCRRPYPDSGFPYRCPDCGGLYDFRDPLRYDPVPAPAHDGLARFRRSFPLPLEATWVSLGEGRSPLIPVEVASRTVQFKLESTLPSGSFKDRGTVVLVNALRAAGVDAAIEDSSGNAGASFAAYAARAGIRARIFVPDSASPVKLAQIRAHGAELVRVLGPRSNASEAASRAARAGAIYASHAYHPHGLAGMATVAFELAEQLGRAPGAVILPVGQGTLLLGLARGFAALRTAGVTHRLPILVGVQARACAPIWAVSRGGSAALQWTGEGETVAQGIRILRPLRGDAVLTAVEESGGWFEAVGESEILEGAAALARLGLWAEPTSAVVWPGLHAGLERMPDPVVAILTGSGYKQPVGVNPSQ